MAIAMQLTVGLFTFFFVTTYHRVLSNYCEWDQCGSDQYCCGDNLCCDYVYSLWYFWVGIVFVIILLSACGGFFRYCYFNSSQMVIHSYTQVPNVIIADDGSTKMHRERECSESDYPGFYPAQFGPPPPYTSGSESTSKHLGHSKAEHNIGYSNYK